MQLRRSSRPPRQLYEPCPGSTLRKAEIQDARDAGWRNFRGCRPDLRRASLDSLHRPGGLERLRAVYPTQCRHPLINGEHDGAERIGELTSNSSSCRRRSSRTPDGSGARAWSVFPRIGCAIDTLGRGAQILRRVYRGCAVAAPGRADLRIGRRPDGIPAAGRRRSQSRVTRSSSPRRPTSARCRCAGRSPVCPASLRCGDTWGPQHTSAGPST